MRDVRVLVVDDHEPFRRAVGELIDDTPGLAVVGCAPSAEESIERVAEDEIDLVLMDVNLPGANGIEATRLLTGRPSPPVVVLVSTYTAREIDYRGCGAAAFISKVDFDPQQLLNIWQSSLER